MFHKTLSFLSKNRLYIIVSLNVILFTLLFYKDIFSDRTLIPNFEPYPDTIHYINPARSFLLTGKLKIYRNGYFRNPGVPPLYSIVLIPLYAIYNDARMFYITNVVLSFLSLFFFDKILKKLTRNPFIIGVSMFLYVTNYFIYWYPTLAMAENLIMALFLFGFYLLIIPVTPMTSILAGIVGISFYGTKYASAPLLVSYIFLYFLKIAISKKIRNKRRYFLIPAVSLLLFMTLFLNIPAILESITASISIAIIYPLKTLFMSRKETIANFHNEPFSKFYFDKYFPQYIRALLGSPSRFLWDNTPIIPRFVGILGMVGLVMSFFTKKFRFFGFSLFLLIFSSIFFMSYFYAFDMRYVCVSIPAMLLLYAFALVKGEQISKRYNKLNFFYVGLVVLFLFYLFTNAIRFKKQIMLNIKYRETPWYYVAVVELNTYFKKPALSKKKPIVISALMPYYIDFFSNGNYSILPLSPYQDFFRKDKLAWGKNDYSDLISLYKSYIDQGFDVYVHNSGLGNLSNFHDPFNHIKESFTLTKVMTGCFETCNIYKLSLSKDK